MTIHLTPDKVYELTVESGTEPHGNIVIIGQFDRMDDGLAVFNYWDEAERQANPADLYWLHPDEIIDASPYTPPEAAKLTDLTVDVKPLTDGAVPYVMLPDGRVASLTIPDCFEGEYEGYGWPLSSEIVCVSLAVMSDHDDGARVIELRASAGSSWESVRAQALKVADMLDDGTKASASRVMIGATVTGHEV